MPKRLVLGTVQLGMPYGIANVNGQPGQEKAAAIVSKAWKSGICEFDTAQGYGNSESVLGKAFKKLKISNKALVISKFDPKLNHTDKLSLQCALNSSLDKLGLSSLYGIMLHREEQLSLWNSGLSAILNGFAQEGKVKHLGVSVYSPGKAIEALNTDGVDFVQLPTNILDRRFENAGVFELADRKNKTIYIRSAFLQGLILMPYDRLPAKMAYAEPVIRKLDGLADKLCMSKQEIALGYLKLKMPRAKIVFGADIDLHVTTNVEAWKINPATSLISEVEKYFSNIDEKILNPTLWPN